MPAASVLMPCYNASATLDEAMSSLVEQTLTNFEVVAVDDGSTDSTLKLLQAWAARDIRVRVLALPHNGIIPALNAGLEACQSDYIARMDADDCSAPDRLALQVAYLDTHPDVAIVSCLVAGFPKGQLQEGFRNYIDWLNSLATDEEIQRAMFIDSPLAHPSVIFHKSWVERLGGYQDHGWPEDYDLWIRSYIAGVHFGKVSNVLLNWRDHPQRLTRTDDRYGLENSLRLKAHYLMLGPLADRDAIFICGVGTTDRRLSKHLLRLGCPLVAYVDIDPKKFDQTHRGLPILPPEKLLETLSHYHHPAVLAAGDVQAAQLLISHHLTTLGLCEGIDWWQVA